MENFTVVAFVLAFVGWASFYIFTSTWLYRRRSKLPPGPIPLPVIGNILELGKNPNQSLAKLAKTYGGLMSLKLGSKTTIIVSSPAVARQIFQKNDFAFSSRTIPGAVQAHDHDKFSMAWLPASGPWRNLRKLTKEQMFTAHRLDTTEGLRRQKFQELRDYLLRSSDSQQGINIGEAAFTTSLNLLSNTLFSVDFASYDSNSSQELKEIVWGIMEIVGTPNLADYFPILKWMDLQGIRHRSHFIFGKMFDIFDELIKQRKINRAGISSNTSCSKKSDLLEALLDHMDKEDSDFSHDHMKHMLLDIFVAGTDTSSATVEWAMAELLRKPEKMAKAREEIDRVIGNTTSSSARVSESDIPNLPYLQGIVKETFRLHPAAPLLVPHKSNADTEINGYTVPKNAQVLINAWASGRDAETWSDPETFCPERFAESEIDARGQHFELIPFGAGRRICPGLPLAYRMVHLLLATLLHGFDWKLGDGKKPEDIDMEEKFGLSVQKAIPLIAIPVKM